MVLDGASLYVAGSVQIGGGADLKWRLEKRSRADGTLTASFGAGGAVESDPTAGLDRAYAVAAAGEHVFVAGSEEPPSGDSVWRIEKRRK
jgi:hypothetical protein